VTATVEEITTLHNRLVTTHGPDAVALASMLLHVWRATEGPARDSDMKVLIPCVHARLRELHITAAHLESAIRDMERVQRTLSLLSVLD